MSDNSAPRSLYDEGCIAAHALDLVGDRWAILVLRELMLGPKRFNALRAGMPGISANMLTRRLEEMTARGLLAPEILPPPARVKVYRLTALGLGFRPVLDALCRWGLQAPGHDPSKFISPTGLMLSMSALVDRTKAARMNATFGFDMGSESFVAQIGPQGFSPEPGAPEADLALHGPTNALAAVVYGPWDPAKAAARFGVDIVGEIDQAREIIDLFSLSRARS